MLVAGRKTILVCSVSTRPINFDLSDSWPAFVCSGGSVAALTDGTISYDEYVYEDKKLIHFHKGCLGRENEDITGPCSAAQPRREGPHNEEIR